MVNTAHPSIESARSLRDPIKAEVKVHVILPPEAEALLRDLHNDRQSLGIAGCIMLICTVIMTLRSVKSLIQKERP